MKTLWEVFIITLTANWVSCTVDGLNYMDPLMFKPLPNPPGENPCNPLYWYPRKIPEFCDMKPIPNSAPTPPVPKLIPVPLPVPIPPMMPMPLPPMMPMPPPPMPMPMPMPFPPSYMPGPVPVIPPLPYGVPIVPSNPMLPVGGIPYPGFPSFPPAFLPYGPENQVGVVPGLPGIVSPDGGINVLPFSDVYSDLLEKHKQKMIRKQMQKLIKKYNYPRIRGFRKFRSSRRRNMDFESQEKDQ